MGLEVQVVKTEQDQTRYILKGHIDERSQMDKAIGALAAGSVIDLSGIERINSAGLLLWVRWINKETDGKNISVDAISYPMAIQANQLLDLFGSAKILSCVAPYYCARCNAPRSVVVKVEEVQGANLTAPARNCTVCKAPMQFDELEDFFSFLREAA